MKKLVILLFIWISATASAQTSAYNYIEKYKEDAVRLMNEHGIPASVILGVAMHESGNGTSKIARYLNNHFGMKGKNSSTKIKSSYRGYESVGSSYENFASMLEGRKQFSLLFNKYSHYDYKNWVKGIQRGGYAASRTWGNQVLGTIKKYKLYQFDNRPTEDQEPALVQPILASNDITPISTTFTSLYKVKRGDTLNKIAKKLGLTVKTLMRNNSLKNSNLKIGQHLKI
ncbi:MAG: glucosaminidase domain-containing protein [Flavobacterium sp.]|nr:glucosaminidase domain-containing protein [Pedobacter sp.]